jgi:iron-sulfur cluster assembly protein
MNKIILTDAARQHFINMMNRDNKRCLTLSLKPSGCNGYSYNYEYKLGGPGSMIFRLAEETDYDFFIDGKSVVFLQGTTIDYVKEGFTSKLVYDNPQAKGSCGCGESYNF